MLILKDCHALFGVWLGLVQDGFYGVMISCCSAGDRGRGVCLGASGMMEGAG